MLRKLLNLIYRRLQIAMMNLRVDELDEQYSENAEEGADYSWFVEEEQEDEVIDETESEDEAEDGNDDNEEEEKYNISESEDWSCNEDSNHKVNKPHLFKNGLCESDELSQGIPLRASTAPARPLTELEDFRRSGDFLLLENSVMLSSKLKKRSDNKYDLDSSEGQRIWKRFLGQIERLCEVSLLHYLCEVVILISQFMLYCLNLSSWIIYFNLHMKFLKLCM